MAKPRADANEWTLKLLDVLQDGQWHDYQEVLAVVSPSVPPGMAWRKAEYYREYHYKKQNRPVAERKYGDRNDTIKTGQRFIVAKAIQDLRRGGRLEVEYHASLSTRKKPSRMRRVH